MIDQPVERLPFFVYGTLRTGGANHAWTLRGRTADERPALLRGALLYDGPGFPYAIAGPDDAVVHGDLITPAEGQYDEVLAVLDRLEGYVPGRRDNDYERVVCEAVRRDGSTVRAWVYFAAEPFAGRLRASATPIAGGDWLASGERAEGPIGPGVESAAVGPAAALTPGRTGPG